jgi:hypothetical protein
VDGARCSGCVSNARPRGGTLRSKRSPACWTAPFGWGLAAVTAIGLERHAEILEWLGEDFDPKIFDPEPLKADAAALAKRWTQKPAAKKPRPA